MTMYYRKMSSDDVDLFRKDSNDKAPEIFYPYGDEKMGL
jgi:hypothetical protein